jgi:hypothetical protein
MHGIDRQLLVEVLAQMAMHYLEQQGDAPVKVGEPAADASDGQLETDRYSYDITAQSRPQAGGAQ